MSEQKQIEKSEEQWRTELTPEVYHVMREHGTERAGSSAPAACHSRPHG